MMPASPEVEPGLFVAMILPCDRNKTRIGSGTPSCGITCSSVRNLLSKYFDILNIGLWDFKLKLNQVQNI